MMNLALTFIMSSVTITSGSVRTVLQYEYCTCDQKTRFETYVKAKELDLWRIILNGDFPPLAQNEVIQICREFRELLPKSSNNYVRKFIRALHLKWRAKVTVIEETKDLSSLALDELIGNLKVHEVVMEKDSEIYRGKKERVKSIALKANKESSDDETLTSKSDDKEYAMAVRNF
nr:UBN2 domain-containing protein [Tanacetum cinerariifolium]